MEIKPQNRRLVVPRHGGPDVFQVVVEDVPEPKAGEVRVRIIAAGVAFADLLMREGLYPGAPPPPFTPGYDLVGQVEALGEGVKDLVRGQRVAAVTMVGAYADYLCLPTDALVCVPDNVTDLEAGAFGLNYLTAYQMLHRCARARSGDRILVHGAAGGVGSALLQLGSLAGLQMFGTDSEDKHEAVRSLGAVPIDYRKEDFVARVRELAGGNVDFVFDPIGGRHWSRSFEALRPGGMLIGFGFSTSLTRGRRNLVKAAAEWLAMPRFQLLELMARSCSVSGYNVMTMKEAHPDWYREDLNALMQMLGRRALRPPVATRFLLKEVSRAHQLLAEGGATGKIVLLCGW